MPLYDQYTATEDDYDFLWNLAMTTMRDYVAEIWGWDEAWQAERFRTHFQPDFWQIITIEGEQAGAFEIKRRPSEIFLAKLYIAPDFQRRGIGSAVVRDLITEAHASGLPLQLDVLRSNPDARRLYERLGLHVISETEDRVFMSSAKL